ncbi:MAG: peptidase M15 [Deltaproteobacteria bacterium]|nr:peptidase M15 [Deltaproteobacteria bacterium]MBW2081602.1 peptidase M15 [Deltaproteobacteria bacterium]
MEMKHFILVEFACPCCGKVEMDEGFLRKLDLARDYSIVPFFITSGYRCERHNDRVGGKKNSAHLRGYAADIKVANSRARYYILEALMRVGFKRIGIGSNFIHVDDDPSLPTAVVWTYY